MHIVFNPRDTWDASTAMFSNQETRLGQKQKQCFIVSQVISGRIILIQCGLLGSKSCSTADDLTTISWYRTDHSLQNCSLSSKQTSSIIGCRDELKKSPSLNKYWTKLWSTNSLPIEFTLGICSSWTWTTFHLADWNATLYHNSLVPQLTFWLQ